MNEQKSKLGLKIYIYTLNCLLLFNPFTNQWMWLVFFFTCREEEGLVSADKVLRHLNLDPSLEDCIATQRVCQIVSTRAAHLCAATLVAVLRQIRDNKAAEKLRTTIGVDGSVYKNHQEYVFLNTITSVSVYLINTWAYQLYAK